MVENILCPRKEKEIITLHPVTEGSDLKTKLRWCGNCISFFPPYCDKILDNVIYGRKGLFLLTIWGGVQHGREGLVARELKCMSHWICSQEAESIQCVC